jgi:hypothetical protein
LFAFEWEKQTLLRNSQKHSTGNQSKFGELFPGRDVFIWHMRTVLPIIAAIAIASALPAQTRVDGQFDRTLRVDGPVELDASTHAGGITVVKGSDGRVHVHAILEVTDDWFRTADATAHLRELESHPPIEQTGNTVRVGYVTDPELLDGVAMHLEIEVPERTKVRAHAHSGGVRVSGLQGPVDCETHSGGIEIRDIAADVNASAHSGGIQLSHIAGMVTAHTLSGGIEGYELAGAIDAETHSGGIRLSQERAAPIRAEVFSGGVRITLARGAGYDLDVASSTGRVSTPEMTIRGGFTRKHVSGTVKSGGPEVTIRSHSGPVWVD